MTNLTKAAREALEALDWCVAEINRESPSVINAKPVMERLRAALSEAPGEEREAFEAWMRSDNTLPLARDAHGYADFTTGLLWHAWQAAQRANAPGGALAGGESGADDRLGLAGPDLTCHHDFVLQPSSSIELCARCGVSKTAARAMLAARPEALTEQQIVGLYVDLNAACHDAPTPTEMFAIIVRAAIAKFCEVNGLAAPEAGKEGGA